MRELIEGTIILLILAATLLLPVLAEGTECLVAIRVPCDEPKAKPKELLCKAPLGKKQVGIVVDEDGNVYLALAGRTHDSLHLIGERLPCSGGPASD